jgi:hypothetical protein
MSVQWLGTNGAETLLDHHKGAFDEWLRTQLPPWRSFDFLDLFYFLTAVTLVDQVNVDPDGFNNFNWSAFSAILGDKQASAGLIDIALSLTKPVRLFDGTGSQVAYSQVAYPQLVSKFLTDRERAGIFCVQSWMYVELTRQLLKILGE